MENRVSKRQAKLGKRIEEELPKLLEASGTGMTVPGVITVQRLKKLRKVFTPRSRRGTRPLSKGKATTNPACRKRSKA